MVGLEMNDGVLKVVTEMDLPWQVREFIEKEKGKTAPFKGYLTQCFFVQDEKIILKGTPESEMLNLKKKEWSGQTILHAGCSEGTPVDKCPSPVKTEAHYSIVSRSVKKVLGTKREVIEVALNVYTEEFGTGGSSNYFFVSGLGMIPDFWPKLTQVRHLDSTELRQFKENYEKYLKNRVDKLKVLP